MDILLAYLATIENVQKVVLAISYLGDKIKDHYQGTRYPFTLEYSDEATPLGTGGGLKLAISKTKSEDLLVLNGDSYFEFDFETFYNFHHEKQARLTIACLTVPDVSRYGKITLDPQTQKILAFSEKSKTSHPGLISGGIYLLKRNLLTFFLDHIPLSLEKEVFPKLVGQEIYALPFDAPLIDIGTKQSYSYAIKFFKKRYKI